MRIIVSRPGSGPSTLVDTGDKLHGRSQGWTLDRSVNGKMLVDLGFTYVDKYGDPEFYTISFTRDQAMWAVKSLEQAMINHDEVRERHEQMQADKRAGSLDGDRIA